ncbi:MAG: VOC family protein, partial [Streptomycetaceae bacterium]|nr:VOC family protein [Streptomycetaceae bacterium]
DSAQGFATALHDGVYVRSFYFLDPDGVLLEFACWRREMGGPDDLGAEPRTAAERVARGTGV